MEDEALHCKTQMNKYIKILQSQPHHSTDVLEATTFSLNKVIDPLLFSVRSAAISYMEITVCHLYRLANTMDDPPRARVKSFLRKALEFPQLPLPPSPRPLVLLLLSHPTFSKSTKAWLRTKATAAKPRLTCSA